MEFFFDFVKVNSASWLISNNGEPKGQRCSGIYMEKQQRWELSRYSNEFSLAWKSWLTLLSIWTLNNTASDNIVKEAVKLCWRSNDWQFLHWWLSRFIPYSTRSHKSFEWCYKCSKQGWILSDKMSIQPPAIIKDHTISKSILDIFQLTFWCYINWEGTRHLMESRYTFISNWSNRKGCSI